MTAKDFMIADVVSVHAEDSIKDLVLTFAGRKVSGVPVVDARHRLVGMVTVSDVLRHLQPHYTHTVDTMTFMTYFVEKTEMPALLMRLITSPVHTIMTRRTLTTVTPNTTLEDVSALFAERRFKKLPVVDAHEKLIGVISRGDLLRYIVREMLQDPGSTDLE